MHTPPFISKKIPILGHSLELGEDHVKFIERGYKEKGSVFAFSFAGRNAVALIGPEYQKAFFESTDKELLTANAYKFMEPITGLVSIFAPHKTYLNQRPILHEPFKYHKMLKYVPIMQRVVSECYRKLGEEGEIELRSYGVYLTREVGGYTFMGEKFQTELGDEFWQLFGDLSASIDLILPPNLPLPKFIKRDKARAKIREMLVPIIAARRANPSLYDDFMQDFIQMPMANGDSADDETIINLLITIMFASHDTTSGHISWTIIQLLQNPDYLEKVKAEIAENFPVGTELTIEKLPVFQHIYWAIEETARMKPASEMLMRFVGEDWEVGGYTIPKGWWAFVSPRIAHFLPEIHENPDIYDPYRFAAGREEDKTCPYQQIGFGGANHKCVGMSFAKNEMAIAIALLFRDFEVELLTKETFMVRNAGTPHPSDTIIRYKRKKANVPNENISVNNAPATGCPHSQK
jgi:sterol 14alpha-demethylase